MGYAGGESRNPTYRDLGGHTETLEVDFDPAKLSFSEVLELFWKGHNPLAARRSRQYMTALFWRSAEQRECGEAGVARISESNGPEVTTKIQALDGFHLAEAYHQKYMLRRHHEFEAPLLEMYPDVVEFTNSTAAARLNGYLAGHGTREAMAHDLPLLGLSSEAQERLNAARRLR